MTLVILEGAECVQSLWADMKVTDIDTAVEALRKREVTTTENIGYWERDGRSNRGRDEIEKWADDLGLDGVVWTALPPKHPDGSTGIPTEDVVLAYLGGLRGDSQEKAEEYIRKAPRQIDTRYRRAIEDRFGWKPTP